MAEYLRGNVRAAEGAFSQAVQLARQASNRNLGLDAVSCLALTQILSGRLSQAERLCQEALVTDAEDQNSPPAGAVYLALARAQYERNELQQALAALKTGIELGRKAGWPHVLWQAFALQAQVRQGLGDSEGAQETLAQAEQVARRYALPRVSRIVSAYRARIELDQGNTELTQRWAAEYRRQAPGEEQHDFEELTLARLLFSQGQPEQAGDLLGRLEQETESAGRTASLIEALVLHATILEALGDPGAAHETLFRAIELARPEGFTRPFLGEGQRMAGLVSRVRQARAPASVLRFSQALISAFDEQQAQETSVTNPEAMQHDRREPQTAVPGSPLIEPLSERELEVLGLIAEGLSNPEIAACLYLSVNTLRAHTSNIYQKLDVHNRVQAASRARELGLLPGDRAG
jgi:LuxR family maltose regulon positive regulatory protein